MAIKRELKPTGRSTNAFYEGGNRVTIIEFRTWIHSKFLSGPDAITPGLLSYYTHDGNTVNVVSKGEYEIYPGCLKAIAAPGEIEVI